MQSALRILFIDDHEGISDGIASILSQSNPSFEFLLADSIESAKNVLKKNPDVQVCILDLNLDGQDGLDAVPVLKAINPNISFLIYTMYADPIHVENALKAGVAGYVTKKTKLAELEQALLAVAGGRNYYGSAISKIIRNLLAGNSRENDDNRQMQLYADWRTLTKTEQELFALLAQKKETYEIAEILGKKEKTVANQKSMIYQKLGIRDRLDLIDIAKTLGVIV